MEFLKVARRRSIASEVVYTALNIALAIGVLIAVRVTDSPLPAFLLVLLSKWRVLGVRPRYWFANIQANLVDLIVSLSLVILLYAASASLTVQIILTALYVFWLLIVKPRSKRSWVTAQAVTAMFVGITALYAVSYAWPSSAVVIAMWLIGYSTTRHVLNAYEEGHLLFLSLIGGLFLAELGWLAYHWTIAYAVPGVSGLLIPQIALIAVALAFLGERLYSSYTHNGHLKPADVILPSLLSLSVVAVLLLLFNDINSGSF